MMVAVSKRESVIVLAVACIAALLLAACAFPGSAHADRSNYDVMMAPPKGASKQVVEACDVLMAEGVWYEEGYYKPFKVTKLKSSKPSVAKLVKKGSKAYARPLKRGKTDISYVSHIRVKGEVKKVKEARTITVLKFQNPFKKLKIGSMSLKNLFDVMPMTYETACKIVISKNVRTKHYVAKLKDGSPYTNKGKIAAKGKTIASVDLGKNKPSGKLVMTLNKTWDYYMGNPKIFGYLMKSVNSESRKTLNRGKRATVKTGNVLELMADREKAGIWFGSSTYLLFK